MEKRKRVRERRGEEGLKGLKPTPQYAEISPFRNQRICILDSGYIAINGKPEKRIQLLVTEISPCDAFCDVQCSRNWVVVGCFIRSGDFNISLLTASKSLLPIPQELLDHRVAQASHFVPLSGYNASHFICSDSDFHLQFEKSWL